MTTNIQFQFVMISSGMLISGLAVLYVSKKSPHSFHGGTFWGLGNILFFIGFLFVGLRGTLPDVLTVFIGNVSTVYAVWYYYESIRSLFGMEQISKKIQYIPLVGSILVFYFYWFQPDYSARAITTSSVVIILVILSVRTILRQKVPDINAPSYFLSAMLIGFGLLLFSRLVHNVINYDAESSIFTDFLFLSYMLSFAFVFMVILTLGFAMLSNAINYLEVHKLAYKDFLTNALSRRAVIDVIQSQISKYKRTNFPFSILMVDVDNLKSINDNYGHAKGDEALRYIASLLKESLREEDAYGRYGGDEFIVVLENTNSKGAEYIASRLVEKFKEREGAKDFYVKFSVGGSQITDNNASLEVLIDQADQALYEVKRMGGGDYKIFDNETS